MPGVADILRRHGQEYLSRFGDRILPSHRRAIHDIVSCRTGAMGGQVWKCSSCGTYEYRFHSCRNRACPGCQGEQTDKWFAAREKEMVNTTYFHLVFTIPEELRRIFRSNQRLLYGVLMKAAIEATQELARDSHFLGGEIAVLAVLHTWTRTLVYHPHIHILVPAVGLDANDELVRARDNFFLPVPALSRLFRGKLRTLAEEALGERLPWVKEKEWVVHCKPTVKNGKGVLRYLARYMFRQGITNSRILIHHDDGSVTFKYKDGKTGVWKQMTLPAMEFIRRFLQHVLPRGLHKVRYAGLWHPSRRERLQRLKQLAENESNRPNELCHKTSMKRNIPSLKCPKCGCEELVHLGRFRRGQGQFFPSSRPPPKLELVA